jgi:iron(III) transport system ATP-binding protein
MPEIRVEGLTKSFADLRVLNNVQFRVREGEFFTLLGPSGCGKSTTLLSIAGFLEPNAGLIACGDQTFFDHDRGVSLPAEERNLGIVFQSYAVWPHMTVFQNVAFPLKVRRVKRVELRERVTRALELVEMAEYVRRYPHELSGGQQQRVALARSLVYSPSVLLLDEPFSNLDAKLRERARRWLKDLQLELALTTIFVTHDQDEALAMSDRVLVMRDGNVLQIDTPENVYRRPNDRFVAEFVGHCNFLEATVERSEAATALVKLKGAPALLEVQTGGLAIGSAVTIAVRPESVGWIPDGQEADLPNTYAARVRARSFLGDHYQYELLAEIGAISLSSPTPIPSESVRIHISPAACSVVERADSPTTAPEVVPV